MVPYPHVSCRAPVFLTGTLLNVATVLAGAAFLVSEVMDDPTILAITAAGGIVLVGVGLRLLELKPVRVASFLPALILGPLFVRLAELVRGALA